MARKVDIIAGIVAESRELEDLGHRIQGERELRASEDEVEMLVERYHDWLGRALAVVPTEFGERLRGEYNGGVFSSKIKDFLRAPGEVKTSSATRVQTALLHPSPTGSTRTTPLFTDRFLLSGRSWSRRNSRYRAQATMKTLSWSSGSAAVFGEFLFPLARRQRDRHPIVMEDGDHVQDFLHGLLRVCLDDVRPEDFSPERAGARSRIDFVLKQERIVVEAKMTRAGLGAAEVSANS